MLEAALSALLIVFDPARLGFVALGVAIGLSLGVIPGLSGIVGLSLLLPFTFDMDPYTALAFLVGLQAVVATSDTIPAVLFGVPGTVGSASTILDGHPMAKQGLAARAFGAAFSASLLGGLFGALFLAFSIPLLRPFILSIGSPELLAFCIFGLSLIGVLSGGNALKGLAAAGIGLMIATVGEEPNTAIERWTFGSLYLLEGIPLVPLALGLFALPEIADMAIARKRLSKDGGLDMGWGQLAGVRDTFANFFLVLRGSGIGSVLGAVPGIGAPVIPWISYGHAKRTVKGAAESFGTGDVRGVIASECSNNAKEGGALVSTIAFGVPATAAMALLLGAFLIHGLAPRSRHADIKARRDLHAGLDRGDRQCDGLRGLPGVRPPVRLHCPDSPRNTRSGGSLDHLHRRLPGDTTVGRHRRLAGFRGARLGDEASRLAPPALAVGPGSRRAAGTLHVHFLPALWSRMADSAHRRRRVVDHGL